MILRTKNIVKSFGGNTAVNNITIQIPNKKITGIIGPNGSGKSTFFNLISKLLPLDQGKIFFKDLDISSYQDFNVAKAGMSRTFQELRIFPYLSIEDHMKIVINRDDEKFLSNFLFPKKIETDRIQSTLDLVGLDQRLEVLGKDLSYGQSKLLNLAMSIAQPHELLLLDEPVAGVNPRLRRQIAKILKALQREGENILLIEHDMNFVMNIVDYVFVMNEGKILAEGEPKAILNKKEVLEAYLGN